VQDTPRRCFCIKGFTLAEGISRPSAVMLSFRPMIRDDRKLAELEKALNDLRNDLNDLSSKVNAEPKNPNLVFRRVSLMSRIVAAQTNVDQLREGLRQA
jgi:hypothetical protein